MSKIPPGCRARKIRAIHEPANPKLRGHGLILMLDCGHSQWVAGARSSQQWALIGERHCIEGPCYQFQVERGAAR